METKSLEEALELCSSIEIVEADSRGAYTRYQISAKHQDFEALKKMLWSRFRKKRRFERLTRAIPIPRQIHLYSCDSVPPHSEPTESHGAKAAKELDARQYRLFRIVFIPGDDDKYLSDFSAVIHLITELGISGKLYSF